MSGIEDPRLGRQRGGGFGRGGLGGGGFAGRERRGPGRARRGDVQAAVLSLLATEDMHGYQIIQELAERSGGAWRPGAGSIYPTLRHLQENGFINSRAEGAKRVFAITEAGRRLAGASVGAEPWQHYRDAEGSRVQLRQAIEALLGAASQVEATGTESEAEKAAGIVTAARKAIYLMLAAEDA